MPRKTSPSPLAARLDNRMAELEATDIEVSALIDRDAQEIHEWRQGKAEIDAEAAILLRSFLADDPAAATAALERIRRTFHRTYAEGDRAALNITRRDDLAAVVRDGERYGSADA